VTGSVTHFEIYAEYPPKLAEFYQSLFGWRVEQAPGIDYWRIQSEPNTANGFNGGLTYRPFPGPRSRVHHVHVGSFDHIATEAVRLDRESTASKDSGAKDSRYAVVADPEGNISAVWQPDKAAFPPLEPD
jgi:uncharacterized protein